MSSNPYTAAGLRAGDVALVHSSMSRTLRETGQSPEDVMRALLEAVGPKGTLLFPLFNFDFTSGTPFDIRSSPSHMGALTEAARVWPGAIRTGHPIYSFAAIGAEAKAFEGVCNTSAYGPDSPFATLRKMDGQIAIIDLPDQNSMTFYHHVEEILDVPYRFHKDFTAPYTDASGEITDRTFSIFVRDLDRGVLTSVDRMGERSWEKGLYTGERPGQGTGMRVIRVRALYDDVADVIRSAQARDYLYDIESKK